VNALHTETRGQFRWLLTVECDADVTIRTARAELPTGLVIERMDGAHVPLAFVTDLAGSEVTLSMEQADELANALGELPALDDGTGNGPP
jgi:hypothetical protein